MAIVIILIIIGALATPNRNNVGCLPTATEWVVIVLFSGLMLWLMERDKTNPDTTAPGSTSGQSATGDADHPQGGQPPRYFKVRVIVDGEDVINVRSGEVWLHHQSAMTHRLPESLTFNGEPVALSWKDRETPHYGLAPLMAPFDHVVSVGKVAGRGQLNVEQPSRANEETLRIAIADYPAGADEYEIEAKW